MTMTATGVSAALVNGKIEVVIHRQVTAGVPSTATIKKEVFDPSTDPATRLSVQSGTVTPGHIIPAVPAHMEPEHTTWN